MTTRTGVLSQEQINQFMSKGYVRIKEAYPREVALEAQSFLWEKVGEKNGIVRGDRSTWSEPMVNLREVYRNEAFDRCNTARLADAVDELVGPGSVQHRYVYGQSDALPGWGWWPVNFSYGAGADKEWTVPENGWHWDGIHFRHYLDSPEQGLLCLCLFSDIGVRGGGTLVVEGSHRPVARFLAGQPDGLELGEAITAFTTEHPFFAKLTGKRDGGLKAAERVQTLMNEVYTDEDGTQLRVVETTGQAGDVFLCHPFLMHAASPNHSGEVRFMCNRTSPLQQRMRVRGETPAERELSPLERSIRAALA